MFKIHLFIDIYMLSQVLTADSHRPIHEARYVFLFYKDNFHLFFLDGM